MSIVSLGRHQLPQPPHRELRRKIVFASRGFRVHSAAGKGRLSARANRNPLRRRATHEETSTQTGRDSRGGT